MTITNLDDIKKMPEVTIEKPRENISVIHVPKGMFVKIMQDCKSAEIFVEKHDTELDLIAPSIYIERKEGIYSKEIRQAFKCKMNNQSKLECELETKDGGDIMLDDREDILSFSRKGDAL